MLCCPLGKLGVVVKVCNLELEMVLMQEALKYFGTRWISIFTKVRG